MRNKLLALLMISTCIITVTAMLPTTSTNLQAEEVEKEPALDYVSIMLPYPIDFVHERISEQFDSEKRNYFEDYNRAIYELPEKVLSYKDMTPKGYKEFMALPRVKPTKFYVFYGAYAVMQKRLAQITPVNVIGLNNPALVRYANLPMSERSYDFYVWSPDTPYWYSEHQENGKPLPFRSYFILHLTALKENLTQVEIIEERPVVRIEGRPSLDENGKLRDYDLRDVKPTTRDRTFLLSCIEQFIQRDVPSRSKFNCNPDVKANIVELNRAISPAPR